MSSRSLYLVVRGTLPSEVPDLTYVPAIFDRHPESKQHGAVIGLAIISAVFLVIPLVVWLVRGPRDSDGASIPSAVLAISPWSWFWCMSIAISINAPTVQDVHPQFWMYEVVAVVVSAQALLVHRLIPRVPRVLAPPPESPLTLGAGERVYWVGRSANRVRLWVAGVAFGASVVAAVWSVPSSLSMLLLVVLVLQRSLVTVRINNQAVRISSSPWSWPQQRVSLSQLARARVVERDWAPFQAYYSDGATYREVTARVFASGPVLVLEGPAMSHLALSLPDAAEAADLLNALIARQRDATRLGSNV